MNTETGSKTKAKVEGVAPVKSPEEMFAEMKQRRGEPEVTMGWKQYNPWMKEKPRKRRFLNTASIWVFAKKMIAQEMRAAKGIKPKVDPTKLAMERFAVDWERKKEEEKIAAQKAEQERQRKQRKAEMLDAMTGESLELFAQENQRLKAEREEQKALTKLFRQALDTVGEVVQLNRNDGGWYIQMEPWEEKRSRRIQGDMDSQPVVYEIKLDKDFYITSCTSGGDPFVSKRILAKLNSELDRRIRKPLELQLEETKQLEKRTPIAEVERRLLEEELEEDRMIAKLCEQSLEDFGRVIKMNRVEDGWKVRIELFEEMGIQSRKIGTKPLLFDLTVDKDLKVVSYQGV